MLWVHGFGSHRGGEKSEAIQQECARRGWTFAGDGRDGDPLDLDGDDRSAVSFGLTFTILTPSPPLAAIVKVVTESQQRPGNDLIEFGTQRVEGRSAART